MTLMRDYLTLAGVIYYVHIGTEMLSFILAGEKTHPIVSRFIEGVPIPQIPLSQGNHRMIEIPTGGEQVVILAE
jgi:hypothetical protein